MTFSAESTNRIAQGSAWRLWVDRCGGYGLLTDAKVSVGGARDGEAADVQVRADWRRREGVLRRQGGDYFWTGCDQPDAERLLRPPSALPIEGSATLGLSVPSPLCGSAVLALRPPHRFEDHVDQILLVDQTILIGPGSGDHIRCPALETSAVLMFREGKWQAKQKSLVGASIKRNPSWIDLDPGRRVSLGNLDMMLEMA